MTRQYVVSLAELAVEDLRSRGILARKVLSVFHGVQNTRELEPLGAYELLDAIAQLASLKDRGLIEISFPSEPLDPSDTTSRPVFLAPLSREEDYEDEQDDLVLYDTD
ncbi:hypothetical protein ACVIGB_000947 [Bradyrhizobium sp. USDA 4341]